jgi:hypothetical protein
MLVTFLWYRCAKRHFLFGRQKESNQRKTPGCVLILFWVVLLVGTVVAGSALMPIGTVSLGLCFLDGCFSFCEEERRG